MLAKSLLAHIAMTCTKRLGIIFQYQILLRNRKIPVGIHSFVFLFVFSAFKETMTESWNAFWQKDWEQWRRSHRRRWDMMSLPLIKLQPAAPAAVSSLHISLLGPHRWKMWPRLETQQRSSHQSVAAWPSLWSSPCVQRRPDKCVVSNWIIRAVFSDPCRAGGHAESLQE